MDKRKTAVLVFITFIATTVLYSAAYTIFPAFGSILGDVRRGLNARDSRELSEKIIEVDSYIDNYYINEYDKTAMADSALKTYVAELNDPFTEYITDKELEKMMQAITGDYTGIGVEVYLDPSDAMMTIISVFDGAPADKSGIIPGDKIVSVNKTAVTAENYNEIINIMRGSDSPKSSPEMSLKVKRGESSLDVKVTRKAVENQTVQTKVLENSIGYIRISQFDEHTPDAFKKATTLLMSDGVKSLIIDLRGNPGGTLTGVIPVADTLLGEGKIMTIKDKQGEKTVYKSDKDEIKLPMCVLINKETASAAEVLAGALRDSKKATLIGSVSYGKGVVQTIFNLKDGSAIKATTAKYYTPSGECIHEKGITPDITIEMNAEKPLALMTIDEDIQLKKAVELLTD